MFAKIKDEKEFSTFFVQHCLYPRLMFSPADALYSIHFVKMMFEFKVPRISMFHIFGQIMTGIIPTIHCCTNNESENLGIFFMEWFQMIDRWANQDVWNEECSKYTGFSRKVGGPDAVTFDYYIKNIFETIHTRFS